MFGKRHIFAAFFAVLATANAAHVDIEKRQGKFSKSKFANILNLFHYRPWKHRKFNYI
jgi:hypothetical protein